MSTWETIELYKSKPMEQMTHEELQKLKMGFLDWTMLKEYQVPGEKRDKLKQLLEKLDGLLSEDVVVREVAASLL